MLVTTQTTGASEGLIYTRSLLRQGIVVLVYCRKTSSYSLVILNTFHKLKSHSTYFRR